MTTALIPCKQPKATVEPIAGSDLWTSNCGVPGCDWAYGPGLKTDVEEQTRWHRRDHRAAVPKVETKILDGGRRADQCQHCGWVTPAGFTTVDDRARITASHLTEHHGLVTC